jgi:hypothetical protein
MPRYLIEWHIDAEDAVDPHDAAQYARKIQLDPDSPAVVFHITNTETGDQTVIDLLSDDPEALTDLLRSRIENRITELVKVWSAGVKAEDWKHLGYPDMTAWRDALLAGTKFSREVRQAIVAELAPMPVAEIEAATGAGHATVIRDLKATGPSGPPGTPRQEAARQREQAKSKPAETPAKGSQPNTETPKAAKPAKTMNRAKLALELEAERLGVTLGDDTTETDAEPAKTTRAKKPSERKKTI